MGLQRVTWGYSGLTGVTRNCMGSEAVTGGYKGLQGFQRVKGVYRWLNGVTGGYMGL